MRLASFANGSYHNGVCRALWAVDLQICQILDNFDILFYQLKVSTYLFDCVFSISFDHESNLKKK